MLDRIEFPHLGEHKAGPEHKMTKGKTVELPKVSPTPVNTLVEEDDPEADLEDNHKLQ